MLETILGVVGTFVLGLASVVGRMFYVHGARLAVVETQQKALGQTLQGQAEVNRSALERIERNQDRFERKLDHILMKGVHAVPQQD